MCEQTEQVDLILLGGDTGTAEELASHGVNVMVYGGRSADDVSGTMVVCADEGVACSPRIGGALVRIEGGR